MGTISENISQTKLALQQSIRTNCCYNFCNMIAGIPIDNWFQRANALKCHLLYFCVKNIAILLIHILLSKYTMSYVTYVKQVLSYCICTSNYRISLFLVTILFVFWSLFILVNRWLYFLCTKIHSYILYSQNPIKMITLHLHQTLIYIETLHNSPLMYHVLQEIRKKRDIL